MMVHAIILHMVATIPQQAARNAGRTAPLATTTGQVPGPGGNPSGPLSLTDGLRVCRKLGTPTFRSIAWDSRSRAEAAFQIECGADADTDMDWESNRYWPLTFRMRTISQRFDEAARRTGRAVGDGARPVSTSGVSEGEAPDGGRP
jgi:hypothetical protein